MSAVLKQMHPIRTDKHVSLYSLQQEAGVVCNSINISDGASSVYAGSI